MSYVVGLDVGTTSVRAIVWDKKAKKLGSAHESVSVNESGCHITSDPVAIYDSAVRVFEKALKSAGKPVNSVATIGLATERASITIWDKKTGTPVIPLILWKDGRTGEECRKANTSLLPYLVRTVSAIAYFFTGKPKFLTGSRFQITTHNVGLKIKHIFQHNPEIRKAVERGEYLVGTLDTWLVWKFTKGAQYVTEWSNFSATSLWDPYDHCWSGIVAAIVSPRPGEYYPPPNTFPKVKDTCDYFGDCHPDIFGYPIPINAVAGDQQASLFGHGCFNKGDTKVTLGTGGFVVQNTGNICLGSRNYIYPLIAWKIGNEITYMLEGSINTVGSIVEWLIENRMADSYDELNNSFYCEEKEQRGGDGVGGVGGGGDGGEGVEVGGDGGVGVVGVVEEDLDPNLVFVPAFSGLSTPIHNAGARGSLFGLTHNTTRRSIQRAVLSSFALRIQQILHALFKDARLPIHQIHVDGGVSVNDYVLQCITDYTGITTVRCSTIEMTSLGAAFLAGLHIGFWKDTREISSLRTFDKTFTCKMNQKTRKRSIQRFNEACERVKDWTRGGGVGGGSDVAADESGDEAVDDDFGKKRTISTRTLKIFAVLALLLLLGGLGVALLIYWW